MSRIARMPVQPNKAVVGANAFTHESGIHQDGLIKERATYEIMTPQSVGRAETRLVLGKHSGRHAMKEQLRKMGYVLTQQQLDGVTARFKELAGGKKDFLPGDLKNIVREEIAGTKHGAKIIKEPAGARRLDNNADQISPLPANSSQCEEAYGVYHEASGRT